MHMTTTPATEQTTTTNPDGSTYTVTPGGTVTIKGSTFHVQRVSFVAADGTENHETHLIGARGTMYLLRPYLPRLAADGTMRPDDGVRQIISLNSGAPWRKHGNEVRVREVGGVIKAFDARRPLISVN